MVCDERIGRKKALWQLDTLTFDRYQYLNQKGVVCSLEFLSDTYFVAIGKGNEPPIECFIVEG